MPLLAPDQLTSNLRETNGRLILLLDSLFPCSAQPGTTALVVTPQQMSGLLSELMRAGQWLRSEPDETNVAFEQEVREYRKQVDRLRALLPAIHRTLLRERARLERERDRVRSAAEWARVSGQTL
jgi:ABC-type nitrate/sulfonate/bicarbonate transport system substrate-binding protein